MHGAARRRHAAGGRTGQAARWLECREAKAKRARISSIHTASKGSSTAMASRRTPLQRRRGGEGRKGRRFSGVALAQRGGMHPAARHTTHPAATQAETEPAAGAARCWQAAGSARMFVA